MMERRGRYDSDDEQRGATASSGSRDVGSRGARGGNGSDNQRNRSASRSRSIDRRQQSDFRRRSQHDREDSRDDRDRRSRYRSRSRDGARERSRDRDDRRHRSRSRDRGRNRDGDRYRDDRDGRPSSNRDRERSRDRSRDRDAYRRSDTGNGERSLEGDRRRDAEHRPLNSSTSSSAAAPKPAPRADRDDHQHYPRSVPSQTQPPAGSYRGPGRRDDYADEQRIDGGSRPSGAASSSSSFPRDEAPAVQRTQPERRDAAGAGGSRGAGGAGASSPVRRPLAGDALLDDDAYGAGGGRGRRNASAPDRRRGFDAAAAAGGGGASSTARTNGGPSGPDDEDKEGEEEEGPAKPSAPKEKANFGLSGALSKDMSTSEAVTYKGVQLKWSEPAEARMPDKHWKLYIFKDDKEIEKPLSIHRQSAYLFGRDRDVADIPMDHPSISKQHAVLQFRLVPLPQEPGDMGPPKRAIKPYVMDLESTNFSFLNGKPIEPARYIELRPQDVLRFGQSKREYVLLFDEMAGKKQ